MKILLLNSNKGPDYQADLFISEIIYSQKYEIYTNHLPNYLFKSFPKEENIYGKGFTVFKKLDDDLKKSICVLSNDEIKVQVKKNLFDLIIYTSIWRYYDNLNFILENYPKEKIITIDGEDFQEIASVAPLVKYYKRELTSPYEKLCYPISFSFPSYFEPKSNFIFQNKSIFLAPCHPGFRNTYQFNIEEEYYNQYASSLFASTTKKAGWDCMRHYEIIASGCIPFFPDIQEKPIYTMNKYPIELQKTANKLFLNLVSNATNISNCLHDWNEISNGFINWHKKYGLSTQYHNLIEP
jgi:hypothetical protein